MFSNQPKIAKTSKMIIIFLFLLLLVCTLYYASTNRISGQITEVTVGGTTYRGARSIATVIPSVVEPFSEALHPPPLTAKGPNKQVLSEKQAFEQCSFFKDGWNLPLMKGDCLVHPTNKHWLSKDVDVSKVRVVHLVKTMDKYMDTRVAAIKDTWAKRLQNINPDNKVVFVKSGKASEDSNVPVITVEGTAERIGLHKRVIDGLDIVFSRYCNSTDWFHVVDDDINIIPRLLLRYISSFDPSQPILLTQLGHQKVSGRCIASAAGGGGMILSKAAVQILIDRNKCHRGPAYDDFELTWCLLQAGVKPTCVQDPEGKLRMLSQNLMHVLKTGYKNTFRIDMFPRFSKKSNPYGEDPFSRELMTWNHNSPEDMYHYDFLFHRHLT